jgi:O-antigen/teichoic acid export membrane protein
LRYTVPLWGVEIITSLLMRLDALVLTALTNPATVGIYGAVTQISNTLRQIRAAFDPIVIAILSRAGAEKNRERLVAGFSYSTVLVVTTQVPVYVFILLFGGWVLGLLGADFGAGESALLVLCGFWVFCSAMGLQGFILRGYGRSGLSLVGSILTLVVQGALLWILIPHFGLVGAALAVGLAYTLLSLLNAYLAYHATGRVWPYNRSVAVAIGWVAVAIAVLGLTYLGAGALLAETPRRIASFIAFSLSYALVLRRLHRAGILLGRSELSRAAR